MRLPNVGSVKLEPAGPTTGTGGLACTSRSLMARYASGAPCASTERAAHEKTTATIADERARRVYGDKRSSPPVDGRVLTRRAAENQRFSSNESGKNERITVEVDA